MHFTAITAAAVLAFTSAAMATGAEPASSAVAQFVAQPTMSPNVMDDTMLAPEEEGVDDNDAGLDKRWNRGGHGQYGNWQKGFTRGAKRDVDSEDGPDDDGPMGDDGPDDDGDDGDDAGLDKRWNRGGHGQYGNWQKGFTRGAKRDVHPGDHYRPGSDDGHGHHDGKSGAEGSAMGPGGKHGGVKRAEHAVHKHPGHWHEGPKHNDHKVKGAKSGDEHGKSKRDADKPEHGGKEGHHGKHWNGTETGSHTDKHGKTKKFEHHMFDKNGTYTGTHTRTWTGTHTGHGHHSKSAQSTSSTTTGTSTTSSASTTSTSTST